MSKRNLDCHLLPYRRTDILTLSEAKQKIGWGVSAFDIPKLWSKSQGEGVRIAVIDTGCDLTHADLKDNLLPGMNFLKKSKPPIDDNGHGTHVAGIICAMNNEIGMVGVAPKAKVVPIKVLDENGSGNMLDVASGIKWAVDQNVDLITLSLGSPNPVQEVRKAIQLAESKGIVTFCAAGNAGKTRQIFYPANYPETIGIGSIDESLDRSSFSCTGQDLDFLAPGNQIFSTVPESWYAILSGTSMANPFAVGVAALLLSYNRSSGGKIRLSCAEDYRQAFRKHTIPVSNPEFANKKFFEGFGIINPVDMQSWFSA